MCKPACPRTYGFDSKEFKQQMRESAEELKVEALKLKEKAKELKEELELELKQKKNLLKTSLLKVLRSVTFPVHQIQIKVNWEYPTLAKKDPFRCQ